ncbi:hypothetical protein E5676_scaffold455G006150 [Cucumis melo var. makuwa]|uniref:Uncharacterized protein n=1 Tax=Cucumis melo var. makuwa TaxID=1194695 RepID=A0A5D3E6P3_CUCMM|nr:hypothetical protein E6C27_scaffold92G002480 [Cucumis melo var. makuwa]TYK31316.1 hypothetical protein E5676_scaffold455G006150 [Cucumis melo var. makuwa]
MAFNRSSDFATSWKAKFAIKLAGIIETKNVLRLLGKEILGLKKESEEGIGLEDALEVRNAIGFGLNELGSRAFVLLAFLPEFLGQFGDEEGGGEWRRMAKEVC